MPARSRRLALRELSRAFLRLFRRHLLLLGPVPLRLGYLTCLGASAVSLGVVCLNEAAPLPSALVEAYWRYAIWAVETAGPTFVKLAQWASTRPDMFDAALCARFAVLHDSTTPHAWQWQIAATICRKSFFAWSS